MSEVKGAAVAVVALVIGLVIGHFIPFGQVAPAGTITKTETIAGLTTHVGPTSYVTSVDRSTTSIIVTIVETRFLTITETKKATSTTAGQTGTWYKAATFEGTFSKTTDLFEVRGKRFRLTWSISGAGQYTIFGFYCYPEGEKIGFVGNPVMVTGSKQTTDSTIVYEGPGKFYLAVTAGNLDGWEIMVEDFY